MKGTLALVIVATIAAWAFLFFPLGEPEPQRPTKSAEVAHDATPRPAEPVARPRSGATEPAADEPPALRTSPTAGSRPRADTGSAPSATGQGDVKIIGAVPPAATSAARSDGPPPPFDPDTAKATGEIGEGVLSPDFKLAEESYVNEPRDGRWAPRQEATIRNALYQSHLREDVVIVNCHSTVCRIQLNPRGDDPFGELIRVPGLAEGAGIDSSTPYSLNGSELIVYARPEDAEPLPK